MPTTEEQAAALAQQVTADYIDSLQAQLDAARAVPQGGYGALPPAIPASGAHYSVPGAYEGYADYGFPPVMYQRSPYATAAYRTYTRPFGQLGVQPLIGFPSAYPHVIQYPGDNPFRAQGLLDAMVGSMWPHWPVPAMPMMRGRMGVGGGVPAGAAPNKTVPTTQPTPVPYRGQERVDANYDPPRRNASQTAVVPQGEPPVRYTGPIRDSNGLLLGEAMQRDENSILGFMSPWFGPNSGAPTTNVPGVYSNAYDEPSTFEQVWDWMSGAGKPTPDELNAEYNAALRQQSPAVMRAAQEAIPLTQIAAPSGVQVPQGRAQLPPVSASLYDAVNTPRKAVLDAMRR